MHVMHKPPQEPTQSDSASGAVTDRQPSAAPGGDSAGGAAAGRGGTGAPPSNTAPDNCKFVFQPLRWGIDSLYLSYPGELDSEQFNRLKTLKAQAQGAEHEASKAQLAIREHVFEVKDKGAGLFPFVLVDGSFRIQLSGLRSTRLPMGYVQVSAKALAHQGPAGIEADLCAILAELGKVEPPTVSRVDLFLDFACDLDMEAWDRHAWVTRAAAISQYAKGGKFTGWSIGEGGSIMARLYDKTAEIEVSGKDYLRGLWADAGWDGKARVWRMEFEFQRDCLKQLGLRGLPSMLANRDGLWSYATTEWLKLTIPNEGDQTRSRWPIHPLWGYIADVDWEGDGGPLLRSYEPTRAPSMAWLGHRALSLVASVAAIAGLDGFDAAASELMHQASNALGDRYGFSGLSLGEGFAEMIEANNRRYNVRLNPPPEPPRPHTAVPLDVDTGKRRLKDGESVNPYERAARGQ